MDNTLMHVPLGGKYQLPWHNPINRAIPLVLVMFFIVAVGILAFTGTTKATSLVYCAFGETSSGEALHASLLQQGAEDPVRMRDGRTGADGCGEFEVIPRDRPVMIVVWTDDGYSSGSTGWIDPLAVTESLAIELKSQGAPQVA
jgi:hypothetical protein